MTKSKAKTIEIFLPDGDPKSIKVASITSRTVEVTYIPRAKLEEAKKRSNLDGVGVYFLVGISEEHSKPEVYIGEAESCMPRILQHNASKDFWQYVLVATSRTNQFTKTHGKYLEWLCYNLGKQAGRCHLNNGNIPPKPHVSESMEADLHDSFETLSVLVSTLGLSIFQPVLGGEDIKKTKDHSLIFNISGRGVNGNGIYTEDGFVVLAGSKFSKILTESLEKFYQLKKRNQLINDKILVDKGEYYELMEDAVFSSPSNAADSLLGRSSNGWTAWKLEDGRTLSDVYRKN